MRRQSSQFIGPISRQPFGQEPCRAVCGGAKLAHSRAMGYTPRLALHPGKTLVRPEKISDRFFEVPLQAPDDSGDEVVMLHRKGWPSHARSAICCRRCTPTSQHGGPPAWHCGLVLKQFIKRATAKVTLTESSQVLKHAAEKQTPSGRALRTRGEYLSRRRFEMHQRRGCYQQHRH